jgi:hypothetical protein
MPIETHNYPVPILLRSTVLDATTSTSPSIPVGPIVSIHAISNATNELAITLRGGSLTYVSARSTADRAPAGFAARSRIKSGKTARYQAKAKASVAKARSNDRQRWQWGTFAGGDLIERVPVLEECQHGAG